MKQLSSIFLFVITLISCNHPGLNEKQRHQLEEGKIDRTIQKVSEAQILEAALLKGKEIVLTLKNPKDTTTTTFSAIWLYDSLKTTNKKLAQLQEAYKYSKENNQSASAHVEFYNKESLLFATPTTLNGKDGIWFIFISKKRMVKYYL